MLTLNKDPERWAYVSVDAVCTGSPAQMRNVLTMALQDIAGLARAYNDSKATNAILASSRAADKAKAKKAKTVRAPGAALPDCMMPDGAEPCLGYQALVMEAESEISELRQAARNLADYYEKSVNVGPGPNPTREALLWARLRLVLNETASPATGPVRQDAVSKTDEHKELP